jgi:hypothetical protein
VLDEAQLVANSSSVAAVMASSLWRRHAWVVTGTPIASKLDEIKGVWLEGGRAGLGHLANSKHSLHAWLPCIENCDA